MKPPEKKAEKRSVSMPQELWAFVDSEVKLENGTPGPVSAFIQELVAAARKKAPKPKKK